MLATEPLEQLIILLATSIQENSFVKLSLGNYQGNEEALKNIYVRLILVKRVPKLSFTLRFKTRDLVKNIDVSEGLTLIKNYLENGFKVANLFTTEKDYTLEAGRNGKYKLHQKEPSIIEKPSLGHDKKKQRLIKSDGNKFYLQALHITDVKGQVYKNAQHKFKQINHYIELLRPLIAEAGIANIQQVADMGSGKGYLTFALYDYLKNELKQDQVKVTGVEFRKDLVELCNQVARNSNFHMLKFVEGTIADYHEDHLDLLVALHACDTATDDAIYKGISAKASLIVVAPCCHKQIRRELEEGKVVNEVSVLTRFGIFLERQAEMLTDGLRALILEYFGYKTKVFEFISDAHTPKNVLIAGVKSQTPSPRRKEELLLQIKQTKTFFGIKKHYLEELLAID